MVIKCRRIRWAEHEAGVGDLRNEYKILSENLNSEIACEREEY
jgi:hypothetical protein